LEENTLITKGGLWQKDRPLLGYGIRLIGMTGAASRHVLMQYTAPFGLTKEDLASYQYSTVLASLGLFFCFKTLWWKIMDVEDSGAPPESNHLPPPFSSDIARFPHVEVKHWTVLGVWCLGGSYIANILLIMASRALGATLQSSLSPVRVVSTLLLSYFLLEERIQSWVSWLGLAILATVIAAYLTAQLPAARAAEAKE